MVVIRLSRGGTRNSAKYRVTVADQRCCKEGRFLEVIGHYIPNPKGQDKKLVLDLDKVKYWVGFGARPTGRVRSLIKMASESKV